MDYMALYYSKEAECQQKDVKISELESRIKKLEEKEEEPYHLGTTDGMGE
tara:strand:+ start:320 stop:469 length:150 start_codon:yes stop_codon:yes gene_type:complete